MKIYTLCSGSEGNATFVRVGETRILIDAGRSCRAIKQALSEIGESVDRLSALFVTHEHIDHIRGIPVLAKQGAFPIYATAPTITAGKLDCLPQGRVIPITPGQPMEVGGDVPGAPSFQVKPFSVPHDSAFCVGYRIDTPQGSVGIATDIGYPTQGMMHLLRGCDYLVFEANHDPVMLKTGPYPYALKQRILSRFGHLSNEDSARCCVAFAQSGSKGILLSHLSEQNNTKEKAQWTVERALGDAGQFRCTVAVAERFTPTCLAEEKY